jgi:hypothetical protein
MCYSGAGVDAGSGDSDGVVFREIAAILGLEEEQIPTLRLMFGPKGEYMEKLLESAR